jgi:hypothetical protein
MIKIFGLKAEIYHNKSPLMGYSIITVCGMLAGG